MNTNINKFSKAVLFTFTTLFFMNGACGPKLKNVTKITFGKITAKHADLDKDKFKDWSEQTIGASEKNAEFEVMFSIESVHAIDTSKPRWRNWVKLGSYT